MICCIKQVDRKKCILMFSLGRSLFTRTIWHSCFSSYKCFSFLKWVLQLNEPELNMIWISTKSPQV